MSASSLRRQPLRSSARTRTPGCGHDAIHFDPSADRDIPCRMCWENREILIQRVLQPFEEAFAAISVESPAEGAERRTGAHAQRGTASPVAPDQKFDEEGDCIRVMSISQSVSSSPPPPETTVGNASSGNGMSLARARSAPTSRPAQSSQRSEKRQTRPILKAVPPAKQKDKAQRTLFSFFLPTPAQSNGETSAGTATPRPRPRDEGFKEQPSRIERKRVEIKGGKTTRSRSVEKVHKELARRSTRERRRSAVNVNYHESSSSELELE